MLNTPQACIQVARTKQEARVIGLCCAQLVISTAQGGYSAWVEDLIVDKNYRHQGIGQALLQAILDWAKQQGVTRAQLLVDRDNQPALAFYKAQKWRETHLEARQYFFC